MERTTVAIARAMQVSDTPMSLLVLDEPTATMRAKDVQVVQRQPNPHSTRCAFPGWQIDESDDLRPVACSSATGLLDVQAGAEPESGFRP